MVSADMDSLKRFHFEAFLFFCCILTFRLHKRSEWGFAPHPNFFLKNKKPEEDTLMSLLTTIFVNAVLPMVIVFLAWVLPLMLVLEFGTKNK